MNMWDFLYGNDRKKKAKKSKKQIKLKKEDLPKKTLVLKKEHTKELLTKSKKTDLSVQKETLKPKDPVKPVEKPIASSQKTMQDVKDLPILKSIIEMLKEELQEAYSASFFLTSEYNILLNDHIDLNKAKSLGLIVPQTNTYLSTFNFDTINQYLFLVIDDDNILFIIKLKDYDLYLVLNQKFLNLGYLINILLPKIKNEINIKN